MINVNEKIELLNSSIREYKNITRVLQSNPMLTIKIEQFNQTNQLFTAIEALIKIPLIQRNIISEAELIVFHKLIQLSIEHLNPNPFEEGIDLQYILKYRDTRNALVHQYKFPELDPFPRLINIIKKFTHLYIDSKVELEDLWDVGEFELHKFLVECNDGFQEVDHTFVLIAGSMHDFTQNDLKALTKLPWNIVIDFDCQSEQGGLRKAFSEYNDDIINISPENVNSIKTSDLLVKPVVYYFADGNVNNLVDRYCKYPFSSRYSDWIKDIRGMRSGEIQLEQIIAKYTAGRDVEMTIVYLDDYDDDFYSNTIGAFRRSGVNFKVVAINVNSSELLKRKADRTQDGSLIVLDGSLSKVLQSLGSYKRKSSSKTIDRQEYRIPFLEGTSSTGRIQPHVFNEASVFFDILHLDYIDETKIGSYKAMRTEFLKGGDVDWFIIKNNDVVKTEPINQFSKEILNSLQSGGENGQVADEYYIKHRPGFGGSTAAKIISWNVHTKFPVLYLKKYEQSYFMSTIRNIYACSSKRILVVVDEKYVSQSQIEMIRSEVFASTLPIVLLFIGRRESNNTGQNTLKLFYYTKDDILEFINHYRIFLSYDDSNKAPRLLQYDSDEIRKLIENKNERNDICPFLIGLSIYKDEFIGIKEYVHDFIHEFDSQQEKAFVYLAMANYFVDSGLPKSFLSRMMFGKEHRGELFPIHFEGLFYKYVERILTSYSIRHYLISRELLTWLLTAKRYEGQWEKRLLSYCIQLIEDIHTHLGDTEAAMKLLQSFFIDVNDGLFQYENNDLVADDKLRITKQFSPLVGLLILHGEDVFLAFDKLITLYPTEAHFYGHTARYFAYVKRDYINARFYAKEAIKIQEELNHPDPNLYHILGICIRQELYDCFRNQNDEILNNAFWIEIRNLVEESTKCFEKTSEYGRVDNKEYSCLSRLQMYMRVLNETRKYSVTREEWIERYIDIAGDLLDEMEEYAVYNVDEENLNRISNFRVELREFYGDVSKSLMDWRNVYDKAKQNGDTATCLHACRRMVHLYELRYEGLHNIPSAKLDEFISLFEDSLYQNPDNERDLKLWFKVARHSNTRSLNSIESFIEWLHSVNPKSYQVKLYRYMVAVLQAFKGDFNLREQAKNYIEDCRLNSRQVPGRTRCYEFLGHGDGIKKIINRKQLADKRDVWENEILSYIKGRFQYETDSVSYIIPYDKYGKLLPFKIFIKPTDTIPRLRNIHNGRDVITKVGFSLDGLRAENRSVKIVEETKQKTSLNLQRNKRQSGKEDDMATKLEQLKNKYKKR